MLITAVKQNLEENKLVLQKLSNAEFICKNKELSEGTIGEHFRHIIELLACLVFNYDNNFVNYDARKRDNRMQTDRSFSIFSIEKLIDSIDKPDKNILLYHNFMGEITTFETTYFRELLYNLEHSIHHQALIKVVLFRLPHILLPSSFGIAPSTIEFKKQCVL
jgi:hypothetical protein